MAIEKYRYKKQQERLKKNELTEELAGPSTAEILQKPALSELLYLALEEKGNLQLVEKLAGGKTLTQEEFMTVDNLRTTVIEALNKSREVIDLLKPETITIIASKSRNFGNLVKHLGIERTKSFLGDYLTRLMVANPDKFQNLRDKLSKTKEAETTLKTINQELKQFAENYNIPESELSEALASYDPAEALRKTIQGHLGKIDIIRNWLGRYEFMRNKGIGKDIVGDRLEKLNKIGEIDAELENINGYLQEIGGMIGNSVFVNEKGREWLSRALRGNTLESQEMGMSFLEAGKELDSAENLNREFEEFLSEKSAEEKKQIDWGNTNSEERNKLIEEFLNRKYKSKAKGGLMRLIIGMVKKTLENLRT